MATVSFRSLQAQPPTPPKISDATTDHAQRFLEHDYSLDFNEQKRKVNIHSHVNLATPPQSSPRQTDTGSSKRAKEVRFIHQPLPDVYSSTLRPILPSKGLKSSKSILKSLEPSPTCEPTPDPSSTDVRQPTFRKMLESTLEMLEGDDMLSRFDAYRILNSSIRAQDAVPDSKALREKTPVLEDFIRRDITQNDGVQLTKDLSLPAVKLAMTLIRVRESQAGGFRPGFVTFLVDQAITIMRQSSPRKDLAIHFMQLLSLRMMHKKPLAPDRVGELLVILQDIHDRISGKNVIYLRLMIYLSLISHYPTSFIEKPAAWLNHAFHSMLAETPDLRDRAMELALLAGQTLGGHRSIAQTAFGLLYHDGAKYQVYFEKALLKSMEDKETARTVPQIWGALMLLLRGDKDMLENWFCSSSWLKIIEECFNSSDPHLSLDTFLAWNRTIFALGSSISCKTRIMIKLRTPIIGYLQRPKVPTKMKLGALSTFCSLLYHSFRPGITQENVTLCWNLYIQDTFLKVLEKSPVNAPYLAKILCALLFNSTVRVWNVDRVLKSGLNPLKLDEVPRLDSQWIRTNIASVSKVVLLLLQGLWQLPSSDVKTIEDLWTSFLRAIAEAGSKEIKLSMDSKKAYAEMTNLLHHLWRSISSPSSDKAVTADTKPVRTYLMLVRTAVVILGPIHLGEGILCRTDSGAFEAAATPSRRTPPRSTFLQSPILAILKPVLGTCVDEGDMVAKDIHSILNPCWEAKGSRKFRMAFGKECSSSLSSEQIGQDSKSVAADVWICIANLATANLKRELSSLSNGSQPRLGYEFADMVEILRAGLVFSDLASLEAGSSLLQIVRKSGRVVAGEAGVLIAVTEPLTKHLQHSIGSSSNKMAMRYLSMILSDGLNTPTQRTMKQARTTLWDEPRPNQDVAGLEWLNALYSSINKCIQMSYGQLAATERPAANTFLDAIAAFLHDPNAKTPSVVPVTEFTPQSSPAKSKDTRVSSKRTPPPRLRHDDSQIQYVAIESSPAEPPAPESQLRTENQKDVRSRQHDASNLFKEIRSSSPTSTPTFSGLPRSKHINALASSRFAFPEIEENSPAKEQDDSSDVADMIDSSPLSRSQRSSSLPFSRTPVRAMPALHPSSPYDGEDIPSSPPEIMIEEANISEDQVAPQDLMTTTNAQITQQKPCLTPKPPEVVEQTISEIERLRPISDDPTISDGMITSSAPMGNDLESGSTDGQPQVDLITTKDVSEPFLGNVISPQVIQPALPDIHHLDGQSLRPDGQEIVDELETAIDTTVNDATASEHVDVDAVAQYDVTDADNLGSIVADKTDIVRLAPTPANGTSVVADSFALPNAESPQLHSNSDKGVSQVEVNTEQTAGRTLANTRRMIATHVLVPSPVMKDDYEDFSQIGDSESDPHVSHEVASQSKKRKSLSPILEVATKRQKKMTEANDNGTIKVRPKGLDSPSLRSLVADSGLLVDKKASASSPIASQNDSQAQAKSRKSRKRKSPISDDVDDVDELDHETPSGKKHKPISISQRSSSPHTSQSPQRRSSRLSGGLIENKRSQFRDNQADRTLFPKSPLSSANASFEDAPDAPRVGADNAAAVEVDFEVPPKMHDVAETQVHDAQSSAPDQDTPMGIVISDSASSAVEQMPTSQIDEKVEESAQPSGSERRTSSPISRESPCDNTTIDITMPDWAASNVIAVPATFAVGPLTPVQNREPITVVPETNIAKDPQEQIQATKSSLARSIIGRLRGILVDCKNLVLGSGVDSDNDESEFEAMQDLAHELQGEILKARRRGRAGAA